MEISGQSILPTSEQQQGFHILIVDDEELARRGVRLLLADNAALAAEGLIISEAANGREAIERIRAGGVDIVFLDIQMPELTGFDVLETLQAAQVNLPATIFVTAYDQYALRAFEASAVDYVLKPLEDERFHHALERAITRIRERSTTLDHERLRSYLQEHPLFSPQHTLLKTSSFLERLTLTARNRTVIVNVEDIDWIEAESYYASIHTGGRAYLMRETMTNLEARLNPTQFQRIHRSAIVNLRAVQEIVAEPHGDGTVVLRDGTSLKLSRSRKQQFLMALK
jgi:two-component system LytT family response regulator